MHTKQGKEKIFQRDKGRRVITVDDVFGFEISLLVDDGGRDVEKDGGLEQSV
jgi:hypothetical protein